jgi:uncharacterized membrane protein
MMARRRRKSKSAWREIWPILIPFAVLAAIGALALWLLVPAAPRITALAKGEDVVLPLKSLESNFPLQFVAPSPSGQSIDFFVEREAGDYVTVAFASCRSCYSAGHYIRGKQILCRRCNQPMERVAHGHLPRPEPDCTHVPIPFERSAGNIIVRAQAVADAFARWYGPVLANNATKPVGGSN